MKFFLEKIGDKRLENIAGCIYPSNVKQFEKIQKQFPEYDASFLWLLCYQNEGAPFTIKYIEENYKKFHQVLDSGFLKIISAQGNFISRMWEMIICDIINSSGKLIPKKQPGADFLLELKDGEQVQIEAVAPDESDDENLRSQRPDYSSGNIVELGGNIEDVERPILLRVFSNGINEKAGKYQKDKPLIIAINSCKVVGTISDDNYVLRRILFGLGFYTKKQNDKFWSFQQNPLLNKPDREKFPVAIFRNFEFEHISGIIYTSQGPMGLIPGGYGWVNHGITFVPNPLAKYKVDINFPFFRRIECNEQIYQEIEAEQEFKSSVSITDRSDS
ncbi:MAG: hypothetical protein Q8P20_03285 [bacterium]|nr:hypothetical protein [bacterium]